MLTIPSEGSGLQNFFRMESWWIRRPGRWQRELSMAPGGVLGSRTLLIGPDGCRSSPIWGDNGFRSVHLADRLRNPGTGIGSGCDHGFHRSHGWTGLEWRFPSRSSIPLTGVRRSQGKFVLIRVIRSIRGSTCLFQDHGARFVRPFWARIVANGRFRGSTPGFHRLPRWGRGQSPVRQGASQNPRERLARSQSRRRKAGRSIARCMSSAKPTAHARQRSSMTGPSAGTAGLPSHSFAT